MIEEYIYGIDECAKAPTLFSMPIAIVKVKKDFFETEDLSDIIIRDSKLMTDKQIKKSFNKLQTKIDYCIEYIYPSEMEGNNLNDLETARIISGLINLDYTDEKVYIDLFDYSKDNLVKRFKKLEFETDFDNWVCEHRADENYKVVSLASIFARMVNLNEMNNLKAKYDVGSGCSSDKKTLKFIIDNYDNPPWFVRTSWITYKRLEDPKVRFKVLQDIKQDNKIRYLYNKGQNELKTIRNGIKSSINK